MTRRRYVLRGEVVPGFAFVVKVWRGRTMIGRVNVRNVGDFNASAEQFGLDGIPLDDLQAIQLLASRGFTGSWSPSGRAPSTSDHGSHVTPVLCTCRPTRAPSP